MKKQQHFQYFLLAQMQTEFRQFKHQYDNTENWKIYSHKYNLVAMRLYLKAVQQKAAEEDRFEDAKQCQAAINEMNKLINA